jgi:hypothetical protein
MMGKDNGKRLELRLRGHSTKAVASCGSVRKNGDTIIPANYMFGELGKKGTKAELLRLVVRKTGQSSFSCPILIGCETRA